MRWIHLCAVGTMVWIGMTTTSLAQLDRQTPKYSPTIDGTITAEEISGQLEIPMSWPLDLGALVVGPEPAPEQLSAKWYVSWNDTSVNFSAIVLDDTPTFRLASGGAYNAQDVIQPCFNPLNDPTHSFNPDPPAGAPPEEQGGPAAIYDMVVETSDEFGPDIYRHGAQLSVEEHDSITIKGKVNATGYVLEASIPWKTAMDDVNPNYAPKVGDTHGLGLILLSFDGGSPTLFTDYGDGLNTIQDPTSWNKMTLVAARNVAIAGDFDGNQILDLADINALSATIHAGTNTPTFDVTSDGKVNGDDLNRWVATLKKTWLGDANLDGQFSSSDLVNAFQAGKYEVNEAAGWQEGDWNANGRFDSGDFVSAFADGGYEQGTRPAVAAVPEPTSMCLTLTALVSLLGIVRTRRA